MKLTFSGFVHFSKTPGGVRQSLLRDTLPMPMSRRWWFSLMKALKEIKQQQKRKINIILFISLKRMKQQQQKHSKSSLGMQLPAAFERKCCHCFCFDFFVSK